MAEMEVRIVELPPLRVASVHAFGQQPENLAWNKLLAWAGPRGLLDNREQHRIFGFNNPNPSAGSPNYGYEFWIVVGPEVEGGEGAVIKEFGGGRYAVTRCYAGQDTQLIGSTWRQLVAWREAGPYRYGPHQWLEEHIGPALPALTDLTLDLYMPLADG